MRSGNSSSVMEFLMITIPESVKTWALARLKEPSTWRGLVWCLTATGLVLDAHARDVIITLGIALAGVLGVVLRESPPADG